MRAVRVWLYVLAALVVVMVAVGGATRLTGSGLSITEWRPVTGAIPPLSEAAWAAEFERYKQIPQYELLNRGMTLPEFKRIYAWEWAHRQLGRLIGLVFFLPLAWFWWRGLVSRRLALRLAAVGVLGAMQAGVGWIMVASGLEPGMTAVAPVKLALHLVLASLILAALVWVAAGLRLHPAAVLPSGRTRGVLVGLIMVQIALGGLVAGSKAGWTYNTWPLMDGAFIPPSNVLFSTSSLIENFVDNLALVQLNHRLIAYLVVAVALWHAATARSQGALAVAAMAVAQATLGV
ncbi:MAG TPA: COX15/CtaA family protein, partial [Beijerinckiaceae bacterium]|nr:COX15/CtaA family protein [Beijerinckiaceae bacterium]